MDGFERPAIDPMDYEDVDIDDEDNPELTEEDFALMRPASEVMDPQLYTALTSGNVVCSVTLKLDPKVVNAFEAQGPDWRERMGHVLAEAAAKVSA